MEKKIEVMTSIFRPTDICWVKNVKRDKGRAWAYYEDNTDEQFYLNFSKTQVKQGSLVQPGEIILLFQNVDKITNVPKKTYLTHLVTPVDYETKLNPEIEHDFKWERRVAVVAKASLDSKIFSSPDRLNFYKPNRGKVCSISLLGDTANSDQIQNEIWRLFQGQFVKNINLSSDVDNKNIPPSNYDQLFNEGEVIKSLKEHYTRERSSIAINLAKKRGLENSSLKCECCNFDFYSTYGEQFIECHHRKPIAKGQRLTSLDDLALVCSNCHRMLHRKINYGDYHSVESLRTMITEETVFI